MNKIRIWPRRWRSRAIIIGVGLLAVAALLVLGQPRARAAIRLVRGFSTLDADPRIHFEAGAEDLAKAVADALPAAVARVEECQMGDFEKSFRVYVCASHRSFTQHLGEPFNSPVRGCAFPWDIWVSPKAFEFHGEDTHRETLAHELSHLHLEQKLGWWHRIKEVPSWFQEGLADWVADTGDEQVAKHEAREAIISGRCIVLDVSGHLPFPKRPESYSMTWPMFHMQSRMFVEYLRSRDADSFADFVASVMRGVRFESAFNENFHEGLSDVWNDFLEELRSESW